MKKILFIATGGTIASVNSKNGLVPMLRSEDILSVAPEIKSICEVDCLQPFSLDSTNIKPEHWLLIAGLIKEHYDNYDGFVIAHGTDTMAYTAAGLSYLIQNSEKPIVITGAQKPAGEPGSDAKRNIADAFICACDDDSHDTHIVFSGSVIAGTRARKNYSKSFAAFGSINFPALANIQDGQLIRYIPEIVSGRPQFYDSLNSNVGLLKLVPGMSEQVLQYLTDQYDGLVVETFGVGGIPEYSDFYGQIKRAVDMGKLIVMTTQVPNEGSHLSVYKVGKILKRNLPILEAHDMTSEAAYAKLMWILSQTKDFATAEKLFYTPVCHDILISNL